MRIVREAILAATALLGHVYHASALADDKDMEVMRFLRAVEEQAKTWDDVAELQETARRAQLFGGIGSLLGGGGGGSGDSSSGSGIGSGGLINNAANTLTGGNGGGGGLLGGLGSNLGTGGAGGQMKADAYVDPKTTPTNLPSMANALKTGCGAPMTITVKSLAEYRLYLDGVQVGYSNGVQYNTFTANYGSSGKVTLAIEATRDRDLSNFDWVDGIAINATICNNQYFTNHEWQCTDTRPWTNNWRLTDYTPTGWRQARIVRDDLSLSDGTKSSYIWSRQCSNPTSPASITPETAFCRLTIRPVTCTAKPCYAEATLTTPDDDCLNGCQTNGLDTCAAIGYRLANKCTTCSTAYMSQYKNYCKNMGCTAAQCQSMPDPAPKPNTTCLAGCTQSMSQISGLCSQQAYQFQSGCSYPCGPETLAYARDYCIGTLGCKPEQCSTFNTTNTNQNVTLTKPVQKYTPPPTPDLTCFFRCVSGMNKYESYCDKINFALTSGCAACPESIMTWAKNSCLSYVDEVTGEKCTPKQCTVG